MDVPLMLSVHANILTNGLCAIGCSLHNAIRVAPPEAFFRDNLMCLPTRGNVPNLAANLIFGVAQKICDHACSLTCMKLQMAMYANTRICKMCYSACSTCAALTLSLFLLQ